MGRPGGRGRSDHRPKRSLGQNFLIDPNLRRRIVEEARVGSEETVVEIGPGRGAITDGLADAAERAGSRLVAVELDDALAGELEVRFRERSEVDIIRGDVLQHRIADLVGAVPLERVRVVGNIPYNLTSPILFHLLAPPRPLEILVMVQREVADRILAEPGTGEFGALTVGIRSVAEVERVLSVPSGAFRPRPKVDSTVVRIVPFRPPPMSPAEEERLRDLVRSVFQWRRKQLGKILRDHPDLSLDPEAVERVLVAGDARPADRPETVSPEGFVAMGRALPAV